MSQKQVNTYNTAVRMIGFSQWGVWLFKVSYYTLNAYPSKTLFSFNRVIIILPLFQ